MTASDKIGIFAALMWLMLCAFVIYVIATGKAMI